MQKERIGYIDIVRGLAIILMVMGHMDFGYQFDYYIHAFHVPVWFFISGWFQKNNHLGFQNVKRKIHKLIIPYFIWGFLQYPVWILFNRSANNKLEPLMNLFWENTNLLMPIAGALWFLTCLFFTELIFAFIQNKFKNKINKTAAVFIMIITGFSLPHYFQIRLPWAIDVSFVTVGFMAIGYYLKTYFNNEHVKRFFNLSIIEIIVLGIINSASIFVNGYVNLRTGSYSCYFLFWINAILAIVVFWDACRIVDHKCSKCFLVTEIKFIGRYSMIYLVLNQLLVLIGNRILYRLHIGNIAVVLMVKAIFVLLIMVILHHIALIFNLRRLSWMIGK